MNKLLDIYSDYLLSSFGLTTATGLSALVNGSVSHDQVSRFLAGEQRTSADWWRMVKPYVRKIESDDGVLIIDDSIAEKPYTDENDHTSGGNVKGIKFLTILYHSQGLSLPVGFTLMTKTEWYLDAKTGEQKRRSPVSKNEYYQLMLHQAVQNRLRFRYVRNDVWFAAADNMMFIRHTIGRAFIMPIKRNRKVALSLADQQQGRYCRVDELALEEQTVREIYLEGVDFPLLLVKQVFANEDGSTGLLYLVTSDLTLSYDNLTTTYRKRWHVERYHQSLKQNASLEKSPTQTVVSQTNHFFAALCAYLKLEWLKSATKLNHFAIKSKLYLTAIKTAYDALAPMNPTRLTA